MDTGLMTFKMAPLPDWLIDLINPKTSKHTAKHTPETASLFEPALYVGASGTEFGANTSAYAKKAMAENAMELANTKPGKRNEALNRMAFRAGQLDATKEDCGLLLDSADQAGLGGAEIRATFASGHKAGKRKPGRKAEQPSPNEHALATAFGTEEGENIRFREEDKSWLVWNEQEKRWVARKNATLRYRLRNFIAQQNPEDKTTLGKYATLRGVEAFLRDDAGLHTRADVWDNFINGINTPIGPVFFDESEADELPDRLRYLTKSTLVAPKNGKPVRWLAFLTQIMLDRIELVNFLQELFGYMLTGYTSEQKVFIFYGTGCNGKSVLLNILRLILHDYARACPLGMFTESKNDRHSAEIARLIGIRLATLSEIKSGRAWDEDVIKSLSGGERITARFMAKDFFEFDPQFKIIIATNNKPCIRNLDEGMRRRIVMVPFGYKPEEPDPCLEDALKEELPQILNWCLEGTRRWLANGRRLNIPDAVRAETDDYFTEMDISAQWVTDRCDIADGLSSHSMAMFPDWYKYLEDKGKHHSFLNSTRFGLEMARLSGKFGFIRTRPGNGTVYERIALKK